MSTKTKKKTTTTNTLAEKRARITRLEIRPVQTKRWHGLEGEESIKRPVAIRALVDGEGMYAVDFKAANISEKEQQELLDKGYDLSLNHNPLQPHPLWDGNQAKIRLEDNTQFVEIGSDVGKIRKAVIYGSKLVANNEHELQEGMWPEATHFIVDEEAEAETKSTKVQIKNNAIIALTEVSLERKKQLVFLLGGKDVKKKKENTVTVELDELVQNNPQEVLDWIKRPVAETSTLYLVAEGVYKAKLTRNKSGIYYGDINLGYTSEEAAAFLRDPKNQELRTRISEQLQ